MAILGALTQFFYMFNGIIEYIYRLDELFGALALIITALITFYSYRIYNFTKKRSYLLFSGSFLFISLGIFTKLIFDILYQTEAINKQLFLGTLSLGVWQKLLLLFYMFCLLAGYILMLIVAMKTRKRVSLLIFIISITALLVSMNYYITFNVIMLIILSTLIIHFDDNFTKKRTLNAGIVWYAFLLIFFGQIMHMIIFYSNKFYLLGNLFHISGYMLLLLNFILVWKK